LAQCLEPPVPTRPDAGARRCCSACSAACLVEVASQFARSFDGRNELLGRLIGFEGSRLIESEDPAELSLRLLVARMLLIPDPFLFGFDRGQTLARIVLAGRDALP
jgi:hypothetical protein